MLEVVRFSQCLSAKDTKEGTNGLDTPDRKYRRPGAEADGRKSALLGVTDGSPRYCCQKTNRLAVAMCNSQPVIPSLQIGAIARAPIGA